MRQRRATDSEFIPPSAMSSRRALQSRSRYPSTPPVLRSDIHPEPVLLQTHWPILYPRLYTRTHAKPMLSANTSTSAPWSPTPSAMWCDGPCWHQASMNSWIGRATRTRQFGLPMFRMSPGITSADRVDQLERVARVELRQVHQRHRPLPHLEVDAQPVAGLAVVHLQVLQLRPAFGHVDVARAVVAHHDEVLVEVHGEELHEHPAAAQQVEHLHGHGGLDVALGHAGPPQRRQARHGQRRLRPQLGDQLLLAPPVVAEGADVVPADHLVVGHRDARGELQVLVGHRRDPRRTGAGTRGTCASSCAGVTRRNASSISSTSGPHQQLAGGAQQAVLVVGMSVMSV